MDVDTDIDIDFPDRDKALNGLRYVAAIEQRGEERRRHMSGVYFQDIPTDPLDCMAVWDYQVAEEKGYFKLDFLVNRIYEGVRDETHLVELLTTEPPWQRLRDQDFVNRLAHLSSHYEVVRTIQPTSIEDLAVCIALIRPGKAHLLYKPRSVIDAEIWQPGEGYCYKKTHSFAYAAAIVVQMNLLIDG